MSIVLYEMIIPIKYKGEIKKVAMNFDHEMIGNLGL
jgi:hypothetical protein